MVQTARPKSGYDAMRQARAWDKAKAIAAELRVGGEYKAFINQDAPFSITKDNYDENDRFLGETSYVIDLTAMPLPCCSCPAFQEHGDTCKHLLAIEIALDMEEREAATEAQVREYEEYQARLEPFGYAY